MLWAKRGWASPGSQFLRAAEQLGATDAWDFVDGVYVRSGRATPDPGLTVTRASSGYAETSGGVLVPFASGELRRTDRGVLVEGARTNLALHSRDLTQAAWTATNVTVARDQVGVDGTANSACSLTATAGNGTVLQAVTHASTARYFSVWIKRITGTGTVEVTLDNGSTWTAVTVTSVYTRVGATQTLANPTVGVRLVTDTDAVAVDFAQLEDGAFPTSPIETAGTAVTRAADVATAVPTAGTAYPLSLFAEWQRVNGTDSTNFYRIFGVGRSGVTTEETALYQRHTNNIVRAILVVLSVIEADQTLGTGLIGVVQRAAARFATNDITGSFNGQAVATDASATLPADAPNIVRFGNSRSGLEQLNGYLRRAAVFNRSLTDSELQGIAT
jgi:hypothetical protein